MNSLTTWTQAHTLPAALAVVLALAAVVALAVAGRRAARRTPAAVLMAALAALACTAYSADTSWRFAGHSLDMVSTAERAAMFAAAELALFACALMARQNLRTHGVPGVPGVLVWFITGVQVIPAYAESGFVGGTVRAVVGPVLAAMLWHLAMGIELRHGKPGAGSQSLPAVVGRELRERLLSRLGLATRDRTAEQITRDRATVRAVQLASRPKLRRWGRARLAAAVARSQVGTDPEQRDVMMRMLAARRGAAKLSTIDLRSPFEPPLIETTVEIERVPETYPALPESVPPVPEVYPEPANAVPAGTRLLPVFNCPGELQRVLRSETPTHVLAAEASPARPEVHAEYVPEPVPNWSVDGTYADAAGNPTEPGPEDDGYGNPLGEYGLGLAAEHFKDELFRGDIPSIRAIKERLRVGQPRAKEIQDGFRKAQVAWRLAGSGATS
ncbi:hypothetical protein [Streptomyces hirsutus]|uniref:hypothetical protein n=1 Tax=Streptomyces hirsutus TaxID=35620 RepID=UPI0036C4D366